MAQITLLLKKAFGTTPQVTPLSTPLEKIESREQIDSILALAGVIQEAIDRFEGEYRILQAAADDFKQKNIEPLVKELDAIKTQVKEALIVSKDHTNYDELHGKAQLISRLEPVVEDEAMAISKMKELGLIQFVKESLKVGDLKKVIKLDNGDIPKLLYYDSTGVVHDLNVLKAGFVMKDTAPFTFKPKFDINLVKSE